MNLLESLQMNNDLSQELIVEINKHIYKADALDKCDLLEAISKFSYIEEVREIFVSALNDENYLVRCTVCEIMACWPIDNAFELLFKIINYDQCEDVRFYAVGSLIILFENDRNKMLSNKQSFFTLFDQEKSKKVKIAYLLLFYFFDKDTKYIIQLLAFLNEKDYHLRCAVLHILQLVSVKDMASIILPALELRMKIEKSEAVRELLLSTIENLHENKER